MKKIKMVVPKNALNATLAKGHGPVPTNPVRCAHCGAEGHTIKNCALKAQADRELAKEAQDREASLTQTIKANSAPPPVSIDPTKVNPQPAPKKRMERPVATPTPTLAPVCKEYKPDQVLIARWDDVEGRHHAPAKVLENHIQWATHVVPPTKEELEANKKAKGKSISAWEGSLKLDLYRIGQSKMYLTLNLDKTERLAGPRDNIYTLRLPTELEKVSVERVIAKEAERVVELEKQAIAEGRTPRVPKEAKPPKEPKAPRQSSKFAPTAKITVVREVKNGACAARYSLLKTGMTVAQALEAFTQANEPGANGFLLYAMRGGVITIK